MPQRILVQGVGGVGGTFAAELLRAGLNPTLITNNPRITGALRERGVRLATPDDDFSVAAGEVYTSLADLPPGATFDAVWLTMKATSVREAARNSRPLLAEPGGHVVAFQNGIVEEAVAAEVGEGRVVSALVAFGANMEAPGVYRRTTPGAIHIGELDGTLTPRLEALRQALSHVIDVDVSQNMPGVLWGKLCWNCAVNGIGALAGYTFGEITATAEGRRLFLLVYREVIDTANALGIDMEPIVAPAPDLYLPVGATDAAYAQRDALVLKLRETYAAVKPSSLQSLERGRKTETEFLNDYVASKAHGPLPLNEAIARMIYEIEDGKRQIDPAVIAELSAIGDTLL